MALSSIETHTLAGFAASVRSALGGRVRSITLFGSRARGEGRDDSDLDVIVIVADMDLATRRIVQDAGWEASQASGLIVSPVIVDVASWTPDLPLAREVARDGAPL